MPLVPMIIEIEASKPSYITEEVKLKAQEIRDRARRRKEEEEKKLEREREKKRIRSGKELLEAKRIEEENERNRFIALRKAEKEEETRARDRIRQKLHQDKLERRWRLGLPPDDPASFKSTTLMMRQEKKDMSVKSAMLPGKSATKAELMRECLRSLRRNHKDDDTKVKRAFRTLLVIVGNVARNPDEEKYRMIRLSNPAFQDRVGAFEEGIEFLELCGFERVEGGKFLYLPRDTIDLTVFRSAGAELQSAITNPFFGLLSK